MKYLYGIIKDRVLKDMGQGFHIIAYSQIACVVKDTDGVDMGSKESIMRELENYHSIVGRVMDHCAIIPIKFPTLLNTEDEVMGLLETAYAILLERLDSYDGKVEVDVTASWRNLNEVVKKAVEENMDIAAFKDRVKTIEDKIKFGAMIKDAVDLKSDAVGKVLQRYLKEGSVDFAEHANPCDTVILSSACLVEKSKMTDFDSMLQGINARYRDIDLRILSPLPPYAFTTMAVRKIIGKEIKDAKDALGVNGFTMEDIDSAYHAKALIYHPDTSGAPDTKEFEKITKAYRLLKNCGMDDEYKDFFMLEEVRI